VRGNLGKLALFVMLAFQLAVGLQWQAASAGMSDSRRADGRVTGSTQMTRAADEHCPMHGGARGAAHFHPGAGATHSSAADVGDTGPGGAVTYRAWAGGGHKHSSTSHDCCRAGTCQCHCVQTPAVLTLQGFARTAPSSAIPTLCKTQFIPTRIDELLRPPIA
jgi:hypothetical protein